MDNTEKPELTRISISLPGRLLSEFDQMLDVRGFDSRSQAISELVSTQVTEHKKDIGRDIMAGTINLVYDHSTLGLVNKLTEIQHQYINEVISSLHINLVDSQTLEVILVQGPVNVLNTIADQLLSCRGVISGKLLISAAILPQLHPMSLTGSN
ncbi:Nickel responsive regulator NikR [hydrothermal vent metagenome]|uniref:Nickel responsive regulator NikR n=1 Tax=hydrothermal vent metagenome TaxID=652676 RepID=A0A3B1ALS3_9ZZZZ